MSISRKILVAPLNWGLGHATRCIPLIQTILDQGHLPIIASDSEALILLKKEFPMLPFYTLPAYEVSYKGKNMIFEMAMQLPHILKAIRAEYTALKEIVKREQIDFIISDNRYGMYHPHVKSIFITHQVNIKVPSKGLQALVNRGNHFFLRKFDELWIPDLAGKKSLAGDLSDAKHLPHAKYIGWLSRLSNDSLAIQYDLAVVLSGPEPQRTYLQKEIFEHLENTTRKVIVVLGKPTLDEPLEVKNKNLTVLPFLGAKDLNKILLQSKAVLCRSGYSSLMDLMKIQKPALLIPTPGQTEQEYLGERLKNGKKFIVQKQGKIDLSFLWKLNNASPPLTECTDAPFTQHQAVLLSLLNCSSSS